MKIIFYKANSLPYELAGPVSVLVYVACILLPLDKILAIKSMQHKEAQKLTTVTQMDFSYTLVNQGLVFKPEIFSI